MRAFFPASPFSSCSIFYEEESRVGPNLLGVMNTRGFPSEAKQRALPMASSCHIGNPPSHGTREPRG